MATTFTVAEEGLERYIDATSIGDVLDMLVNICHGKAKHLRDAWQDDNDARAWERIAHRLNVIDTTGVPQHPGR